MTKENNEFVIVETGGKQYLLEEGSVISIEKTSGEAGDTIELNTVLLHSKNGKTTIGSPNLEITVSAEILAQEKDKKVRVFKFKKKTGFKKTQGHRQNYSTIKITSISAKGKKKSTKTEKESKVEKKTNAK